MRVCLHTIWDIKHDFIGGTERFLVDLSKELKALGYYPFIVCTGAAERRHVEGIEVLSTIPSEFANTISKYGNNIKTFFREEIFSSRDRNRSLMALSRFVYGQISQFPADIYHLNSFASAAFIENGRPMLVTNHENEHECDHLWGCGFFEIFKKLVSSGTTNLHRNKTLTVPSPHYAKKYSKELGLEITPVKQGVSLTNFIRPRLRDIATASEPRVLNLLLPSRFEPHQKGHDIAVLACQKLKSEGIDMRIVFTGMRDDYIEAAENFRESLVDLDIADCLTFKRYHSIQDAYEWCDIVISPERYCSYGLSVSESLSLGVPTVLSDIPTYVEIASSYSHAFFFTSEIADSLALQISNAAQYVGKVPDAEVIRFRCDNDLRNCAKKYSVLYGNLTGS